VDQVSKEAQAKSNDWVEAAYRAVDWINADYDVAIEEHLIGAMMVDADGVMDVVSTKVSESEFYDTMLGQAFSAFCLMHEMGKPLNDPMLVIQYFKKYGIFDHKGDGGKVRASDLAKWVNSVPNVALAPYYATEVRKAHLRRTVAENAIRLLEDLTRSGCDVSEASRKFVTKCDSLATQGDIEITPISVVAKRVVEKVRQRSTQGEVLALQTELRSLDNKISGLAGGELCIIAARPGGGKSAIGMQIASNIAKAGHKVLFVSLEMPDDDLTLRMLKSMTGISNSDLRTGKVSEAQIQLLEEYANTLTFPLSYYAPKTGADMKHIRAAAKLEKTDLLVVDYLQRIKPADNRRNRNEQIGEMTRGLSELAKELSIPVVCLCQLNRESEGQTPKLSHLRESGDIEQDANIILAIHTIKDENDEETPHKEIHILKNREGSMGKIQLAWKPAAVRFEDDTELPF